MTLLRPLIQQEAGEITGVYSLRRKTSETGDLGRSLSLNQCDLIALSEKLDRFFRFPLPSLSLG